MSAENLDIISSYPAAADYSAVKGGRFVVINTSGQVATVSSAGTIADGVLHNKPASGEQARVVFGTGVVVKMEVGTGGLTAGSLVFSDANGKAVNSSTAGQVALGRAPKAAAAGDVAEVIYLGPGKINP